jgi:hypothetical protein
MCFTGHVRISSSILILLLLAESSSLRAQVPEAPPVPDSPSLRPETVKLEAAFLPGKTYRFLNKTKVRMQLPGRGIREIAIEHQARFDSKARGDGKAGAEVKARTERLNIEIRSGEKQYTFDSLKEEDKEKRIGKHFRASLNRWVDLTLNRDFRVVNAVEGGRAGIASPLPGMPQFGPKELQQLVALIPQGLPEDPVAPGDEWVLKGSREVGEVGTMGFDITYRHAGAVVHEGHNCVQIDLSGRLSGDVALPSAGGSAFSGGRMDFQGTSLRGKIIFDPKERTIRLSEQMISMLMELPGAPGEPPSQIPVEQTASLRLIHVVASPGL